MNTQEMKEAIQEQYDFPLMGWVEVEIGEDVEHDDIPNGIYHCPLISDEEDWDVHENSGKGWTLRQMVAMGMGFNEDGSRPHDNNRITNRLDYDEVGIKDGYAPVYLEGRHIPPCIRMVPNVVKQEER